MAEITLDNGTVVKNVPEGTTKEQVQRKIDLFQSTSSGEMESRLRGPNHPTMSGVQSFGRGLADRTANNLANVPDLFAGIAARAATPLVNDVKGVKNAMTSGFFGSDAAKEPRAPIAFGAPPLGQDFVPGPSGPQLLGGVQRVGEAAAAVRTGNYNQFSQNPEQDQRSLSQRAMEQNPWSYFSGQIGGDVLSLTTMRAPMARGRATQEHTAQRVISGLQPAQRGQQTAGQLARRGLGEPIDDPSLAMSVTDGLKSLTNSKGWRALTNRAGRSVETGAEAAVISVLNGEADPSDSFAYAAGLQGGSSLVLGGAAGLFSSGTIKGKALNLGVAALAAGSMWQIGSELTAGGNNFILESMESGFSKVAMFLAAGLTAGALGMGRVNPSRITPHTARIADAISSLPRAATISLMTEMQDDPAVLSVVQKLSKSPDYFGPALSNRLGRAFENGNFRNEMESLMSNEDFRKKFEAIQ